MAKNIVVYGAGAIGSCIAAYLEKEGGHDLTVVDPWYAHIISIQKNGLHVTDPDGEFDVEIRALHHDQIGQAGPIDILFLAVKSMDTEMCTRYLAPYLSPDGYIVSAQNSLNEEIIAPIVGQEKTMGLVVTIGAGVYKAGELLRDSGLRARLAFQVGELDGSETPRLRELAKILDAAGITKVTDDIWAALWTKLAGNSMGNALSGITGQRSYAFSHNAVARKVRAMIGREVILAGEAHGIEFGKIGGVEIEHYKNLETGGFEMIEAAMTESIPEKGSIHDKAPSLLQDVIKVRRSEVDYLNGLVARKGKEKGVPTPVNDAVVEVMRRVDNGELKPDGANAELFKEFLWE
jgi:2-dehydropantoate 2-reductase